VTVESEDACANGAIAGGDAATETLLGESRWPPVVALVVFMMPLTHRAKYAMVLQSTLALALFGLVVARAVNAFT
jgi:hypothetical protein